MSVSRSTFLERALSTEAPPSDPASARILDAALELVAASGLRHLTMEEAAARAGLGRMTVYRRFGDRQGLIDALAAREARSCLAELDRAVDPSLPVAEGIARGFASSVSLIRTHPLLARFARHEPEAALSALNANGGAILVMGREFVAGRLREAQARGDLGPEIDPSEAAELLVRLALSFLLMPDSALPLDDLAEAARTMRSLIDPILARSA
ncbi:MAG: TetR/AcrR family transcriptional regulator [Actinomycetota bacterium]|nr:TetR/AcrR family transcriptional regulator [Actinomycetota bacterium]